MILIFRSNFGEAYWLRSSESACRSFKTCHGSLPGRHCSREKIAESLADASNLPQIVDKCFPGYSGPVNNMLHIDPVAKHAHQAVKDTLPILRQGFLMRDSAG